MCKLHDLKYYEEIGIWSVWIEILRKDVLTMWKEIMIAWEKQSGEESQTAANGSK